MVATGGHGWNYLTEDPSGPANWGSFYSTCNGDRQSPVDLTGGKRVMSFPPLILQHYDETPAPDSLAVLGVFFQVSDLPNKGMEDLLTSLKEVKTAGTKVNVTPFPLSRFWLGEGDLSRF